MINSLFKDSHITQYCRFQKSTYHSKKGAYKTESSSAPVNNSNIITKKPAEISFSGFSNATKNSTILKGRRFKALLEKADENQVVFSAGFALLLTCLLRPAAIMTLPGKKNKDDKKYASAHSMASGVIGFVMAFAISNPISNGIKKVMNNPEKYIKKKGNYLKNGIDKTANNYLNKLPDIFMAIPKGIITIALIPPILKYVFGWEKKNPKKEKIEPMSQDFSVLNFKSADSVNKKVFNNFRGGEK